MASCYNCGTTKCAVCLKCHYCGPINCCTPPRTQKAKGVYALCEGLSSYRYNTIIPIGLVQSIETIEKFKGKLPCFARPCPPRPRHGYLESRVVKTEADLRAVVEETFADNPLSEVMLMPFVDAKCNMIWTPGMMSVGKGHDGATGGKGVVSIPLAGLIPDRLEMLLQSAAIDPEKEWPFVEAVIGKKESPFAAREMRLTQLRGGPKGAVVGNYIPSVVEVRSVIRANPDLPLEEWSRQLIEMEKVPGTVIYHPTGAPTDHISVQARTHSIPVIFDREPVEGEVLTPAGDVTAPDPEAVLMGAVAAAKMEIKDHIDAHRLVHLILIALHHSAVMNGVHGKWLGAAAVMMLRLGSVALKGEARHLKWSDDVGKPPREQVYSAQFNRSIGQHRASVNRLINIFRYGEFRSSGIGGPKWATCGAALVPLFNALRDLAASPDDTSTGSLIRALNTAVNQAHNGGWWLNKFTGEGAFNSIQEGDLVDTLEAAPAIYDLEQEFRELSPSIVRDYAARWAKWPLTSITPPKVSSVEMHYADGMSAIQFRLRTRLLGDKQKPIIVKAFDFAQKMKDLIGEVYLVNDPDNRSMRIECRPPARPPITLWTEQPINPEDGAKNLGH